MAQICKKCGYTASDNDKYCPVCCSELDLLKKEESEKREKNLVLLSKKALAFSIIATLVGIIFILYVKFSMGENDILSEITPVFIWTGLTGIAFAYAYQSRKAKKKIYLAATLIIGIIQLIAVPVLYVLI